MEGALALGRELDLGHDLRSGSVDGMMEWVLCHLQSENASHARPGMCYVLLAEKELAEGSSGYGALLVSIREWRVQR